MLENDLNFIDGYHLVVNGDYAYENNAVQIL